MSRKLGKDDLLILRKLAPELADPTCGHAGHEFRSVLPPISQHISPSPGDFSGRLMKLTDDELNYLVGKRISKVKATELLELYKFVGD